MSVLTVGSLYIPNYGGIHWTQPGGVGTTVFPQQNTGPFWNNPGKSYPLIGPPFAEAGQALWISPCGHGFDTVQIFRDYDSNTSQSAAVVCCPICSFLIELLEPYSLLQNYLQVPIVIP